mgnify:CR=1 FL=1
MQARPHPGMHAIVGRVCRLGMFVLGALAFGCATVSTTAGPPTARAPAPAAASAHDPLEFSVYEVDTPAFLEKYLSVRVCQGWTIQQIMHSGDKFIVVMYRGGSAQDRKNCGEV